MDKVTFFLILHILIYYEIHMDSVVLIKFIATMITTFICITSSPVLSCFLTCLQYSYLLLGLLITVPVVSDMSTNGNSNDDCSSGSGGGSPDAAGSDGVGKEIVQIFPFYYQENSRFFC